MGCFSNTVPPKGLCVKNSRGCHVCHLSALFVSVFSVVSLYPILVKQKLGKLASTNCGFVTNAALVARPGSLRLALSHPSGHLTPRLRQWTSETMHTHHQTSNTSKNGGASWFWLGQGWIFFWRLVGRTSRRLGPL